MSINIERIADSVASQYEQACKDFDRCRAKDRAQVATNSKDGQTVSFGTRFEDKAIFDDANLSVSVARGEAHRIIAEAKNRVDKAITDAPSADEANYIAAISGRDDMSEAEVKAAMNRYRSHAAQHAIVAAANRSGLKGYYMTEAEAISEALDKMDFEIERAFSMSSIGNGSEGERIVTRNSFGAIASGASGDTLENQFKALFGI